MFGVETILLKNKLSCRPVIEITKLKVIFKLDIQNINGRDWLVINPGMIMEFKQCIRYKVWIKKKKNTQ